MSTIIKHKEFPKFKSWTMDLCGRPLTIEVGKVAELASASAMVKYGETTVMVAVTVSPRPRDGVDFFPLSVDFEEKLYAVGRIPGSFLRREGQPSLPAVLASRVIDRSIRPLFPGDFRNDVVVTCTVMSVDRDCSPEAAAMVGVSACLAVSNIPWGGPIGCLEVGYVDGEIVLNPNQAQKHASKLDLTVAASKEKVVMIEAGADEIPDEIMYAGIVKAHEEIKKQVAFINQIVAEIGKEKFSYPSNEPDEEMFQAVTARSEASDIIIKAAAVADYTPCTVAADKIKKSDEDLSIPLQRTQDILGYLGAHRREGQFLCGFSMETRDMVENSIKKLQKKHVDMIAANNVKVAGAGFGTDTNLLTLITQDGTQELPLVSKLEAAHLLLDQILARRCK